MSYNQIRSAGIRRKEISQYRKPLGPQVTKKESTTWSLHHHHPNSSPSFRHLPEQEQRFTYSHPIQSPRLRASQTSLHNAGVSGFSDHRYISQIPHGADNRGYTNINDDVNQILTDQNNTRYSYPPVQALQTGMNRPLLNAGCHGNELLRFVTGNTCQPIHRPDNRIYSDIQNSNKRTKTEYGHFSTSQVCPPRLPLPSSGSFVQRSIEIHPNEEIPIEDFHDREKVPSNDEGLFAVVSEEKTVHDDSSTNSSTIEHPHLLALPEDKSHLTALHCFVRLKSVYIFCAEAHEVNIPRKGRKKPLTLGQIGIGCFYCKGSATKLKGCSYYPSSISGIYNATMIIQQRHFPVCPLVTKKVYQEFNTLKSLTARSAATKDYWITSAKKLGLVDTTNGVFFRSMLGSQTEILNPQNENVEGDYRNDIHISAPQITTCRSLVEPSDRVFATEYAYFIMAQMTTTTFTESDRLGKRKRHTVGFPGLACKYCYGGNGSGRFFPLTLKTFSDVSKSLHVLRNHLVKCVNAPAGLSAKVNMLHQQHENDKARNAHDIIVSRNGNTPFGSQKIFFDHVWRRLHPEMYDGSIKSDSKHVRMSSSSSEELLNDNATSHLASRQVECISVDTQFGARASFGNSSQIPPLPPVAAANLPNQVTSGSDTLGSNTKMKLRGNQEPYSDADVSVAIILATGMGRQY